MPPRAVTQPYFHSTCLGADPGLSPDTERGAGAGERRGSNVNLSEHEQLMRSPENTAGAQDLVRKEENLSAAQDCPGLAGQLANAGRTRMAGGHRAPGGGTVLRTGGIGAVRAPSTGEGRASHSAAFSRCNQTEPCMEVCIKCN